MRVELRQTKQGVSLLHSGRLLTKVYLNRSGMPAASAMAQALGTSIPPLGETRSAVVSSGLLYRVLSLSALDFRNEVSYDVAERLLEEAEAMRGSGSDL